MKKNTIDIITLGCSKNLVDSERLIRQLEINGYKVTHDDPNPHGEIIVINTCGFIADAKEESVNMILECCQAKAEGRVRKVFVMGCLSQRYFEDLGKEIPEVDKFYGKFNWNELIGDLGKIYHQDCGYQRRLTTPKHYAYLKISEGCNRRCAFCAIPIITGNHQSRPMEDIVAEVEYLVSQGVKEFQIIAQELTYYGVDIYGERRIAQLVRTIADIKGVKWVRLHYAYPKDFPMELLDVMNEKENVCKYLDIALQHVATNVLKNMSRHIDSQQTYDLITEFRKRVPGIHIRTTLMVGFPGEGEEEFLQHKCSSMIRPMRSSKNVSRSLWSCSKPSLQRCRQKKWGRHSKSSSTVRKVNTMWEEPNSTLLKSIRKSSSLLRNETSERAVSTMSKSPIPMISTFMQPPSDSKDL